MELKVGKVSGEFQPCLLRSVGKLTQLPLGTLWCFAPLTGVNSHLGSTSIRCGNRRSRSSSTTSSEMSCLAITLSRSIAAVAMNKYARVFPFPVRIDVHNASSVSVTSVWREIRVPTLTPLVYVTLLRSRLFLQASVAGPSIMIVPCRSPDAAPVPTTAEPLPRSVFSPSRRLQNCAIVEIAPHEGTIPTF